MHLRSNDAQICMHLVVSVSYTEYTNPARVVMNLRLKNLQNETVNLDVHGCVPRFWSEQMIPGKESRFTSITGTPLSEIRVSTPQEIMDVRGDYYPHYCADVSFNQLCRWIYGWTTVIDVDSHAYKGPTNAPRKTSHRVKKILIRSNLM